MPENTTTSAKKCTHCGRGIAPVGHSRNNGKNHPDWEGRTLHKKCWREIKQDEQQSEKARIYFKSLGVYLIKE